MSSSVSYTSIVAPHPPACSMVLALHDKVRRGGVMQMSGDSVLVPLLDGAPCRSEISSSQSAKSSFNETSVVKHQRRIIYFQRCSCPSRSASFPSCSLVCWETTFWYLPIVPKMLSLASFNLTHN